MTWTERVYDPDHLGMIHVENTDDGLLTLTTDDHLSDNAVSIKLNANEVRKLRLACSRWERGQK